jgi:integration host factor subunit beta
MRLQSWRMIRSELIARIAAQNPHLYLWEAEQVIDAILDTMATAMARGDRLELRGFGVFEVRQQPGRIVRNPRNQAAVEVPPRTAVRFKPSKAMTARLKSNARPTVPEGTNDRIATEVSIKQY